MMPPARRRAVLIGGALATLAIAIFAAPVAAQQTTIYENNFSGAAPNPNPPLSGWTIAGGGGGVAWAADNTPNPPGAFSNPNSLNYNDGVDYDNGAINSGTAQSPAHTLTGTINPQLTFMCAFETDLLSPTPNQVDMRQVLITNGAGTMVIQTIQFITLQGPPPGGGVQTQPCLAANVWHPHTIDLNPYVAQGQIRIRFSFNTVSALGNIFKGWFIDDYKVIHAGSGGGGGGGGPTPPTGQGPVVGAPPGDGGSPNNHDGDTENADGCATVVLDERSRLGLPVALALTGLGLILFALFRSRRPRTALVQGGPPVDSRTQRR